MDPLSIYSSRDWFVEGNKVLLMLAPFWGFNEVPETDPDHGRFKEFLEKGKNIFLLTSSLKEAEIAVYPQEYRGTPESLDHLKKIAALAQEAGKKLLVFYNADDDAAIPVENCIIFRTSFYKSRQRSNEYALPGWSLDFLNYFPDKKWIAIDPVKQPSVSYCGYVDYEQRSLKGSIKVLLKPTPDTHEERAKATRGEACRKLKGNQAIETNFIIRNGFWAHGIEDKRAARKQYAENMIGSLYGIATRGGGNFSYRLYELLSCGRIPVFINTDAVLPFDWIIDWKKHVVWLERNEVRHIDEVLLRFHSEKTKEELHAIQLNNRKLYEYFISPLGFHQKLAEFLKQEVK